jgi:hypothetical protein
MILYFSFFITKRLFSYELYVRTHRWLEITDDDATSNVMAWPGSELPIPKRRRDLHCR